MLISTPMTKKKMEKRKQIRRKRRKDEDMHELLYNDMFNFIINS